MKLNLWPALLLLAFAEARAADPAVIHTTQPVQHSFTRQLPWIGSVESKAVVELQALVSGRVTSFAAEDQERIETGSLVAQLSGPQIESRQRGLTNEIASLRSRLELARQTTKQFQESLHNQLITKDQLAAAQDAQDQLAARLQTARLQLETLNTEAQIVAPISGIFTKRQVCIGQEVSAGQLIGQIIDTDHLRIRASLFAPPGTSLEGKPVSIQRSEGDELSGTVQRVLPETDDNGAVQIWIDVPRLGELLRPGQSVGGTVLLTAQSPSLAVPADALQYDDEENAYLFVQKNGTYDQRQVQPGQTQDGWVEILSGLEPDEPVVTQGAYELFYRRFNTDLFRVQD